MIGKFAIVLKSTWASHFHLNISMLPISHLVFKVPWVQQNVLLTISCPLPNSLHMVACKCQILERSLWFPVWVRQLKKGSQYKTSIWKIPPEPKKRVYTPEILKKTRVFLRPCGVILCLQKGLGFRVFYTWLYLYKKLSSTTYHGV